MRAKSGFFQESRRLAAHGFFSDYGGMVVGHGFEFA